MQLASGMSVSTTSCDIHPRGYFFWRGEVSIPHPQSFFRTRQNFRGVGGWRISATIKKGAAFERIISPKAYPLHSDNR